MTSLLRFGWLPIQRAAVCNFRTYKLEKQVQQDLTISWNGFQDHNDKLFSWKPAKCLKPSLGEGNKEQSWKNTVLKSTAHESISGGLGSFLKNCYYCKKLIDQGKDVYMYRDLCAFCTEDCRSLQIELDEKSQMQSAKSGGVVQEQDLIVLDNGSFVVKH
ncbi:hypothetical protein ACET3Z_005839 [Daucus carota]